MCGSYCTKKDKGRAAWQKKQTKDNKRQHPLERFCSLYINISVNEVLFSFFSYDALKGNFPRQSFSFRGMFTYAFIVIISTGLIWASGRRFQY